MPGAWQCSGKRMQKNSMPAWPRPLPTRAPVPSLRCWSSRRSKHHAILEAEYRRLFEPDLELAKERLPITWYEWDEESFELADTLELPVMLYITAPWCEPCHLMEETTLADPDVVAAINDDFIPIMVDADKRPDVDSRYNKGGWPTTAFLNADGEVLESHNFLTAEQMMSAFAASRPGMLARRRRRPDHRRPAWRTTGRAGRATRGCRRADAGAGRAVAQAVVAAFDREHGGFGAAPKFHHADVLEFALAVAHRTGDERWARLCTRSLEAMAQGGLHDRCGRRVLPLRHRGRLERAPL